MSSTSTTTSARTEPALSTIRELWRFPVKSMGGERVETLQLTDAGGVGDRLFAVQQKQDGRLLTARLEPRLLMARARLEGGVARMTLPGRITISSDSRDVDRILSGWLGRDVTLIRAKPGRADATHLIPVSAETAAFMAANPASAGVFTRATVGFNEDLGPVLEWKSPGAGFSDGGAVHLLSGRQLHRLRRTSDAAGWSARRFRPNIVLDLARGERDEDSWLRQVFSIGRVRMRATEQCIRCILATRAQPGLPDDPRILTSLRPRRARLGIYADVERGGTVAVGQVVEVRPAP